jgi:hypothetical protein
VLTARPLTGQPTPSSESSEVRWDSAAASGDPAPAVVLERGPRGSHRPARDSDAAVTGAVAGERQAEADRAPYCTPAYVAMEAGASWVLLGHARTALPILEQSRAVAGSFTGPRLCVVRGAPS